MQDPIEALIIDNDILQDEVRELLEENEKLKTRIKKLEEKLGGKGFGKAKKQTKNLHSVGNSVVSSKDE